MNAKPTQDMSTLSKLQLMEKEANRLKMPEVAAICNEAVEEIRRLQTYEWMYRELCE